LQAIPKGQFEGADSLGLSYWQQMRLIVLPQALKIVIPPLVGLFIALFKDTSLVVIIGIFDLTQAAKAALTDQAWRGFSVEVYIFISAIYFVFCYSMSKYSQSLEKRLATGHER
jgi:general L-amino acid transport system permease protein